MKEFKSLPTYFLLFLLFAALYFGYLIFKPYFAVIIMAAIFALIFHPAYAWMQQKMSHIRGSKGLSAFLTVLMFVLIILIPLTNFIALLVRESIESYPKIQMALTDGTVNNAFERALVWYDQFQTSVPFLQTASFDIRSLLIDIGNGFTTFVVKNANNVIAGTSSFFLNVFFMLITMYYLLKDGDLFMDRLMRLTPLPNKYDRKLFEKFRDVSKSTVVSSLLTAVIQGVLAGIAYVIVGLPGTLFLSVATAIASLIPFVGTALVTVPVGVILLATGKVFSGIFVLAWAAGVIGLTDNLIRTKLIQTRSNIHPLLVFFSIFGGISLWGPLGIIFGPLVLAIVLTVLHIYELEYDHILEK